MSSYDFHSVEKKLMALSLFGLEVDWGGLVFVLVLFFWGVFDSRLRLVIFRFSGR